MAIHILIDCFGRSDHHDHTKKSRQCPKLSFVKNNFSTLKSFSLWKEVLGQNFFEVHLKAGTLRSKVSSSWEYLNIFHLIYFDYGNWSDNFECPFLEVELWEWEEGNTLLWALCALHRLISIHNPLNKHWKEHGAVCLQNYYQPIHYESDVRKLLLNKW